MSWNSVLKGNLLRPVVGVVGGGQLAKMLGEAAKLRNVGIMVQTQSNDDPAASKANGLVLAAIKDASATSELVRDCCSVTFENEWVNIDDLILLENQGACFVPPIAALKPLVNKIDQRKLLDELRIPGPDWIQLSSSQIKDFNLPVGWDFPVMAKSGRGGYDGKGTKTIKNSAELRELFELVDPNDWLIERWVQYQTELALVASRDLKGHIRTFPLAETNQTQQVCDWVLAPADVSHSVEVMAYNIAASLMTELNYVGVIAIEFFYGPNGLLVNEIAPRTHNSAHFSIEACNSSQFDQQICITAGLSTPDPELIVPGALMVNLLGLPEGSAMSIEERIIALKKINGAHLHWYNKTNEIPGRKLGHVTLLLDGKDSQTRRNEALKGLESIRSIWPINVDFSV